jgi:hypothetical protein
MNGKKYVATWKLSWKNTLLEKIGKKMNKNKAIRKNKFEKEKPKRKYFSEADVEEIEKQRDIMSRDAKMMCEIGL